MEEIEKLYYTVMSDRNIMKEFVKASGTNHLSDFAETYGCIATESEIRRFFIEKCEGGIFDYENFDPPVDGVNFEQLLDQFK